MEHVVQHTNLFPQQNMESVSRADCVVHGNKWRGKFQCLLNKMRSHPSCAVPHKYIRFWPQLICICDIGKDKYKTAWKNVSVDSLNHLLTAVTQHQTNRDVTPSTGTNNPSSSPINHLFLLNTKEMQPFLKLLNAESTPYSSFENLSLQQMAIIRLLSLISRAEKLNFTLEQSFISSSETSVKRTLVQEKQFHIPISEKQFQSQKFLNYLVGKKGSRIKTFAKNSKCLNVTLGTIDRYMFTLPVTVKVKKIVLEDNASEPMACLDDQLTEIQGCFTTFLHTNQKDYKGVCEYFDRKSQTVSWIRGKVYSFPQSDKLTRQADFNVKALKHQQNRSKSARPTKSVLDRGHCRQCRKPFTDLHQAEPCIYHHGYIVNRGADRQWTCCQKVTEEHFQTFNDHSTSGCCSSKTHIWRVNKKEDKGHVSKSRRHHQKQVPGLQGSHGLDDLYIHRL